MSDDVGATFLEKGTPFADSAGRPCCPSRGLLHWSGLRNPQKGTTRFDGGCLGTAFPEKGGSQTLFDRYGHAPACPPRFACRGFGAMLKGLTRSGSPVWPDTEKDYHGQGLKKEAIIKEFAQSASDVGLRGCAGGIAHQPHQGPGGPP